MPNDFNAKLKKCENLQQVFNLVNEHYDTSKTFGVFTGNMVKSKIPNIISLLQLKEK
jgi:hypothetical protein